MTPPFVDPDEIRRQAEGHGYPRGVDYFRQGAVRRVVWDDRNGILTGTVDGSTAASYRTTIRIDGDRSAGPIVWTNCTCPMQASCKHTVATLLAANAQAARALPRPASTRTPDPTDHPVDAASRGGGPGAAAPAGRAVLPESSWRDLVPRTDPPTGSELALGVELRVRPARGGASWVPRKVATATARLLATGTGEVLVGLRPLVRSPATGNWIRGAATWDALRRPSFGFRADQVRWLLDLHSIARDQRILSPFTDVSDWITLGSITSDLLWPHLATAAAHAVAIVSVAKGQSVQLAAAAEASVVVDSASDGGLRLKADVRIDGLPVDVGQVRPVARTGVYAWQVSRDGIAVTLAPVALSGPLVNVLQVPDGMPVPAGDVDEFLRTTYPQLARGTALVAAPGVKLPEPKPPVLELTVRFRPREVVEFAFEWVYPDGVRHPYLDTHPGTRLETAADRDVDAEQTVRARLDEAWARAATVPLEPAGSLREIEAAEFIARTVPELEQVDGIRVVSKGRKRAYRELTGDPEITVSTVESADPDWFDLGVTVTIGGQTIPFQPLFTALATRRTKLLLVDGTYFSLAHPALDRLRELIDEAAELTEWETGPRISRYQTTLWEDFEDLADVSEPAVSWRAAADGLREVARIEPATLPQALHAQLRPYQRSGFDWLAFLWEHRLGGILADDMGLGKTVQMLAFLAHARETGERRPFLVVAPTSVLPTWRDEASRFVPGLRVAVVEATRVRRGAPFPLDVDVIVTSYTLVRLDEAEFADVQWAGVVLDEAQFAKNPATKLHKALARLHADVTFALTGTPMENTLAELWALLSLTSPGLFPSARRFRQDYIGPIEQGKVPENQEGAPYRAARLERLRRRVRPLMLRRTKESVAADLPSKQEQILPVELAPAHRALYDTVLQRERQKVLGLLEDLDRNRFIVFRSLTLLRMLSLSPALIDPADARIPSAKLDVLVDQVSELAAEGHRTLVFSQFTSFLQQAAERLDAAGLAYEYLDGSTRKRADVISSFRDGQAPVFLISLKAGGFGLTLTEADYVFLLDPWWNPAAESQAVDRTHRIGQTRSVFVYRLISTGTIEEKVLALQQRKARLFRSVMDDDDLFARALTADDIRALFAD
ncbi:DEAD/DEAH box helicase [Microbacterium terrisoli]|uniref:DEAD/DEAH box helicase n=1 Tax=Microbacterium terrisoli TaxID=3242192 RepID=UPI0028057332|nr:SNF2-related protein [Microbacterium protaetiae]